MVSIVYKMKFVSSKKKPYATYINYMDRDEAVRTEHYKDYNFAFDDLKKIILKPIMIIKELNKWNSYLKKNVAFA